MLVICSNSVNMGIDILVPRIRRFLVTWGAPGSSRVALGTRMGHRRPFIAEKGLATKANHFAQPMSVSQKRSP